MSRERVQDAPSQSAIFSAVSSASIREVFQFLFPSDASTSASDATEDAHTPLILFVNLRLPLIDRRFNSPPLFRLTSKLKHAKQATPK